MPTNPRLANGSLSLNPRKWTEANGKRTLAEVANDRAPDYFGSLDLAIGETGAKLRIRLFGWVRKSAEGHTFLSLAAEYPQNETRRLALSEPPANPPATTAQEEELPF
ncbi:MAG: hypothetical protein ACI4W7_00610 [Candidatus Spyradenecus sp.]